MIWDKERNAKGFAADLAVKQGYLKEGLEVSVSWSHGLRRGKLQLMRAILTEELTKGIKVVDKEMEMGCLIRE